MNVHLPTSMSKAAFISWMERQEEHYELVRGRVVMMPRPARRHALIVGNVFLLLRNQLDAARWQVMAEFGLDTEPRTLRYPDILVDAAGGAGTDYSAVSPVLAVEVLSPSSIETDLGDKAAEYLNLPSLQAYFVFSRDEPKAWTWVRGQDGFSPGPRVIEGMDQRIVVEALDLNLRISAVYAGLPAH